MPGQAVLVEPHRTGSEVSSSWRSHQLDRRLRPVVIDSYHRLFQTEKSFRMSNDDLQARPIYHHKRDSIEAHLTVVFVALAVSRWIEDHTGWSIRRFVRTARRYRTIEIQAGSHTLTAADPLPDDLHEALRNIHNAGGATH